MIMAFLALLSLFIINLNFSEGIFKDLKINQNETRNLEIKILEKNLIMIFNSLMKSIILLSVFYSYLSLYGSDSSVVQLTQSNFKKLVIDSDDLWMVEFYAPWCGHCKSLAPHYEKASKALKGFIKVGAVDMTVHQSIGSPYGIKGFPTLKFFGADKKKPVDYNQQRTTDSITNFCLDQAKKVVKQRLSGKTSSSKKSESKQKFKPSGGSGGNQVVELNENEFNQRVLGSNESWFILFYAPWCGHCKKLMPEWEKASGEVDPVINFGKLDCTAHKSICGNYGVQGYPTLKFFTAGKVEDYNGGRGKSDLTSFAGLKAQTAKPPKELQEMVDQSMFDDYCKNHDGLCFIAFLPHIKDSGEEKRNQYIKQLDEIKKKHRGKPVTFLWAQGGNNFDFEEALNLGFGFPCVVAIHYGKGKFSIMRANYNQKNIDGFIGDLGTGKATLYNLRKNLPKIKKKKVKKTKQPEPVGDEL